MISAQPSPSLVLSTAEQQMQILSWNYYGIILGQTKATSFWYVECILSSGVKFIYIQAIVGVYLSQCISHLSPQSLESIANKVATLSVGPVREMLQGILVEAQTHQTPKADNLSESPSWKAQFRILASELILPDELSWMDEDNGNLDEASIVQAMNDVRIRFERSASSETVCPPETYLST